MNISKTDIDDLNASIQIKIERKDYEENVRLVLKNYRKKANIPGFRKGHVPLGIIKKQYEQTVIVDEVNKLLRESLDKYIKDEKIQLLGNPIPKSSDDDFDWTSDEINFEFDLGITPQFKVKLDALKKVVHYDIEPESKMINEQILHFQNQFGKLVSQNKIEKGFEIIGQFIVIESEFKTMVNFMLNDIKSKKVISDLMRGKIGSKFIFPLKTFFKDESIARRLLGVNEKKWNEIVSFNISIELKEINQRIPAPLNKELFDKLYKPGEVNSKIELKDKIKEKFKMEFEPQANQKLMNDISEVLVKKTKFQLPDGFLKKWIKASAKESITDKEASEEYNKSKKGIRYQLIEDKIIKENELNLTSDEIKNYAKNLVKKQMQQYGQVPKVNQLEGIVTNILSNNEEVKKISEQLMLDKMLDFYKKKAPLMRKKVGFDTFIKEAYSKA